MTAEDARRSLGRFGRVLYEQFAARGWSARRFATESGTTASFLSAVATGLRPPPLARLRPWAEQLGLDAVESEAFVLLGQLAHAPPELARVFDRQLAVLLEAAAAGVDVEAPELLRLLAAWRAP